MCFTHYNPGCDTIGMYSTLVRPFNDCTNKLGYRSFYHGDLSTGVKGYCHWVLLIKFFEMRRLFSAHEAELILHVGIERLESRNIYLYQRKCVKFNTWFRAGHCASIMSIREHNYNKYIRSPEYSHPNNIESHIIRWTALHVFSCSTTATEFSGRSFQN